MHPTVPNIISLARLGTSPLVLMMLLADSTAVNTGAALLFVVSAATDLLDGWLARKTGVVSEFGRFIDPLADKFLVLCALLGLTLLGRAPLWVLLVIAARDVLTTAMRSYADRKGHPLRTSSGAKVKTFAQMLLIVVTMVLHLIDRVYPDVSVLGLSAYLVLDSWFLYMAYALTALMAASTLLAYMRENKSLVAGFWQLDAVKVFWISIASGAGLGFMPVMPGTFASLAAACFVFFVPDRLIILGVAVVLAIPAIPAVRYAQMRYGLDHRRIVIDEILGFFVAVLIPIYPLHSVSIVVALVAFRLFDITKPFPISRLDRRQGSFWVIADDLAAGLMAAVLATMANFVVSWWPLVAAFLFRDSTR